MNSLNRALPRLPTAVVVDRPEGLSRVVLAGYLIIAALVFGFMLWSWLAPLGSAVNANGQVIVDGNHKTIQHLERGIVREILVKDGDKVSAGQVLVRLDDTQAKAALKSAADGYHAAEALVAQLAAEQALASEVTFPADLVAAAQSDRDVAKMLVGQTDTFAARHRELVSQTDILNQRIAQAQAEIGGRQAQIAAEDRQTKLLAEELNGLNYLLAKGLIPKPQVLEKQRMQADIVGQRAENVAEIARARQTIGEDRMHIGELRTALSNEAAAKFGDAQKDMFDAGQRVVAAQDVLDRTVIRAPEDGVIIQEKVHTPGGVVEAGEALMDIVPESAGAIIDVKVDVNDITKVRKGLPAELRLVGYDQRTTPTVAGTVIWVSADRIEDQKQHPEDPKQPTAYYEAHLAADPAALAALPGVSLHVGMPVEASIATGDRTLLQYVMAPLSRVLTRGMREK
ncbi:MAG TPA: HlyD family type I secretion periplasmic adaptor subunit [Stellaceae bacterium]|nr:HlyD family type I secretion periplasmic adaptor subunit [Stellaceae bacterium]